MSNSPSDIHERRPAFEAIQKQICQAQEDDYFKGVNPVVLDRWQSVYPIGIRPDGSLDVPADNDPLSAIPLLVVPEGESVTFTHERVRRNARTQLQIRYGMSFLPEDNLVGSHTLTGWTGIVTETVLKVDDKRQDGSMSLRYAPIPLLLIVEYSSAPEPLMAAVVAHEIDHWDFQSDLGKIAWQGSIEATADVYSVTTERRAYSTSHLVEHNSGLHSYLGLSIEYLSNSSSATSPEQFVKDIDGVIRGCLSSARHPISLTESLMAGAITMRYGDHVAGGVTADEIYGYRAAQLIV